MSSSTNPTANQGATEETDPRDFKTLLDQASDKTVKSANKDDENTGGLLEKVTEYVPALGKLLGKEEEHKVPVEEESKPPGPPVRPHNDTQIEEFVRDQHRSKNVEGVME